MLKLISEETSTRSDTITHKIEKGIPIPAKEGRGRYKGELRLTMEQMEVGDSVVINTEHHAISLRAAIKRIHKGKTAVRICDDKNSWRVWRTK